MKLKFKILSLIFASLIALSASGCTENYTFEGGEITTVNVDDVIFSTAAITEEVEVIEYDIIDDTMILDRTGNLVSIPNSINSIVSISSSATEILVGLGFADKIIMANTKSEDIMGIKSSACTINPENININELIALAPDVLIVTKLDSNDTFEQLRAIGTEVILMPESTTIQSVKDDIAFLAEYTKTTSIGDEYIKEIDNAVNEVTSMLAEIDIAYRPQVYFELEPYPNLSCGNNTIADEIITLCGGSNIYADTPGQFSNTSESVIAANPDVIIVTLMNDGYDSSEVKNRVGWGDITAVKEDRIYHLYANHFLIPSHKIARGIRSMARAIYPELFAENAA